MKTRSFAVATSLIAATIATVHPAIAQVGEIPDRGAPYFYGHDMMWGGSQWGGFGMILGPIFMILIVVAIIAGTVFVIRHFGGPAMTGGSHVAHDRALGLLKERYAKGEIDSKEFEERKRLLAD